MKPWRILEFPRCMWGGLPEGGSQDGVKVPPDGGGALRPVWPPPACPLPFPIFTLAARMMEPLRALLAQVSLAE